MRLRKPIPVGARVPQDGYMKVKTDHFAAKGLFEQTLLHPPARLTMNVEAGILKASRLFKLFKKMAF